MHDELRFIWHVSPIGLAKVARDGTFLATNPRFAEIVGYSETELLARTYQQITHPDDLVPDTTEANNLASNPEQGSYQMVKRYISKDGKTVWVNLYVHAICDSDGTSFKQFFVFAAELTPVTVYTNNSQKPQVVDTKVSIWNYIKSNPKEAAAIASAIIIFSKGGNIVDLFEFLIKK